MRGKGEGSVFRVPKDPKQPLKYWTGTIELPPINGERRRKVVRRKNKKELLTELDRLRSDLALRGDIPTANQTVEQWFTYWVEQVAAREVRPNTLDGYRRTVKNHIIPAIGKVKLDKLTATHIRRVHDAILAKGLSSTTALLAHRTMAVSFKIAVREGRIGRNPTALTNAPRKAKTTLEALDLSEAIRMIEHASTDPVLGARWAMALLTGARRGEVLGLERDRIVRTLVRDPATGEPVEEWHLDLSWQLLRLKLTDVDGKPDAPVDYEYRHLTGGLYLTRPKSNKSWRVIPLVDPLKSILERHLETAPDNPWGLVFTLNDRPIGPDIDSANWRKALTAAGIDKNVRLHDARHTAVDLAYAAGIKEEIIMEIFGHSMLITTRGYRSHVDIDRLRVAMRQLSDHVTPAIAS